jgi:hypothetical protein
MLPTKSLRLDVYLAWINAWPFTPRLDMDGVERIMSVNEMARLFKNENLLDLLETRTPERYHWALLLQGRFSRDSP